MAKRRQLRAFDLKQIASFDTLIGVDEAGRGPLAGPVVAGAVRLNREFLEGRWAQTRASRVNDSKQLTPETRDEVFADLQELAAAGEIALGVGRAEIGAAWSKRSEEGRDYLSLKLDDPSFNAPIYANLFDDEGGEGYTLLWSRPRKTGE